MSKLHGIAAAACALTMVGVGATPSMAADGVKWVRSIPLDLAMEAGKAALAACRGKGASVGVVDHNGHMIYMLVDDNATMFGQKALPKKLHTAIIRQSPTQVIVNNSKPGGPAPEVDWEAQILNRFNDDVLVAPGAIPIFVGTGADRELLGAIGVAGVSAPGTGVGTVDEDQACAMAGLAKIQDRLK